MKKNPNTPTSPPPVDGQSDIDMAERLSDDLTRLEQAEVRIETLETENDELLKGNIDKAINLTTRLLRTSAEKGIGLEVVMAAPAIRILTESILQLFGVYDIKNYIGQTISIGKPGDPEKTFEIVVKRKIGKTPSEIARDERERANKLQKILDETVEKLEQVTHSLPTKLPVNDIIDQIVTQIKARLAE